MSIIGIIVWLAIFGVVLYVINAVVPMPAWVKTVINCIAIVAVCLFLLDVFGLYPTHLRFR